MLAVGTLLAGIATFFVFGAIAQATGMSPLTALVASELAFLAIPLVVMRRMGLTRQALGLRAPARFAGRYVGAAVLIGCTAWYLNMRLVELLPLPEGNLRTLADLVDQPSLPLTLLTIAVIPAICEEVMFRGVVLGALATRFVPLAAVVLSALLFSFYHLSVIQLLPTFTLGLVLGAMALRGGSVFPAMLAHFLNNALAVVVSRHEPRALVAWLDVHPTAALIACGASTAAGLALIARAPA